MDVFKKEVPCETASGGVVVQRLGDEFTVVNVF